MHRGDALTCARRRVARQLSASIENRYDIGMTIEIGLLEPERHAEFTAPLLTAFGLHFDPERSARMQRFPEIMHRIAAFDGATIVGSAGAFQLTMTTPGGSVPVAGLTMVGVLPTHRRRGVLTSMVKRHFEIAREKACPISALWASESSIYGRFGYGMATFACSISLERDRSAFRKPPLRAGSVRLLDDADARAAFPPIYERVRAVTPGMMGRSDLWWEYRRLANYDKTAAPLQRALLEVDGKPEGYAIYRLGSKIAVPGIVETDLAVAEAIATSPRATSLLWRYLCDIDLVRRVEAMMLPPTHPLRYMLLEPRRLRMSIDDALWLRLVDAEAALAARAWPSNETVAFALRDAFCPWNSGVYRITDGRAVRAQESPDLELDAAALGSLYLGGVSPRELADAGEIEELTEGAIDRADALFRSVRQPWCPELF